MLQNYHIAELTRARESKLYHCVYLLAHSIIQTVSEVMFGLTGHEGTRFFLEHFVDGATEDKKFSTISHEIHDIRNIIAHRGYSKMQHEVYYFADHIEEGWRREDDGSLTINPALYSTQVEDFLLPSMLDPTFYGQKPLKLLQLKYRFIRQWLDLDKKDALSKAIKALDSLDKAATLQAEDAKLRRMIYEHYGL